MDGRELFAKEFDLGGFISGSNSPRQVKLLSVTACSIWASCREPRAPVLSKP